MKRRRNLSVVILLLAGLAWFSAEASAAIIYVDATDGALGNTTLVDGSTWTPLTASQGASNDGVWARRAFGNSATIYQNAASGNTDNAHRLLTTISGLIPGAPYDVFVYFWSDASQWRINAGLTNIADLPQFGAVGGHADPTTSNTMRIGPQSGGTLAAPVFTSPDPFTTPVMIGEGNRRFYQGYLGVGNANGTGQILVYVDDDPPAMTTSNERTWYDGVGYELIPEPATWLLSAVLALIGFGSGRYRC